VYPGRHVSQPCPCDPTHSRQVVTFTHREVLDKQELEAVWHGGGDIGAHVLAGGQPDQCVHELMPASGHQVQSQVPSF
jgi:hypothetical protein